MYDDDFPRDYNKSLSANILVIGKTGAGKSSLLNYLFDAEVEKTGAGSPVQKKGIFSHEYQYDKQFKINIFDSWGLEADKSAEWKKMISDEVQEHDHKEIHEWFNTIIYCSSVDAYRFEEFEADIIKELREKKNNVIVVITHCKSEEDDKALILRKRICLLTGLEEDDVILVSSVQKTLIGGAERRCFGREQIFEKIVRNLWRTFKVKLTYIVRNKVEKVLKDYTEKFECIINKAVKKLFLEKNLEEAKKCINNEIDDMIQEVLEMINTDYKKAYNYYDVLSRRYLFIESNNKYLQPEKLICQIGTFTFSDKFRKEAEERLESILKIIKAKINREGKLYARVTDFIQKLNTLVKSTKTIKRQLNEYAQEFIDNTKETIDSELNDIEMYISNLDIEKEYLVEKR